MERLKNKIIAIDSMILIKLLERDANALLIKKIFENSHSIIASILTYLEVAVGCYQKNRSDIIQTLQQLPVILKYFKFWDLNLSIADTAAKLRAKYQLKTPDSIHIATAIENQADYFLSEDKGLHKIREIPILDLKSIKI